MRQIILALLVFLSIIAKGNDEKLATITINAKSEYPIQVVVEEPFEGMAGFLTFIDTSRSNGFATHIVKTKKLFLNYPTYIRVVTYDNLEVFRSLAELIVCPNENVVINLELKDGTVKTSFSGTNAAGHLYFDTKRLDRKAFYAPIGAFLSRLASDTSKFIPEFKRLVSTYTRPYDSLYVKGAITKDYLNAICENHKQICSESISFELIDYLGDHFNNLDTQFRNTAIDQLFKIISPTSPASLSLLVGSGYLLNYASYLQLKKHSPPASDSIVTINNKKIAIHPQFRRLLFIENPKLKELLWVIELSNSIITINEMTQNQLNIFATIFPNSKYIPYVNELYKKNHIPTQGMQSIFPTTFIDSTEKYKKLEDLLKKHFNGKKVFIDFWATWCGPCKGEFKYNQFADSVLKSHGVERLYISLDSPKYKNAWIEDVKKFHLGGSHVLAGKELLHDLGKVIPFTGIPHFAIINAKGEVVDADAKRPSHRHLFIKNLQEKIEH